jgi:DNA mismatch repair ATPase MutL
VTNFFEHIPVRKQTAIRNSVKALAKIKRLLQAYALARPAVRFRFRVLKALDNKGDFVYAPKADCSIEDAVMKVIGKDCALQCDWTVIEASHYDIHAFLPKRTASGSKIVNQGAFISIDARPVSSSRGTIKQIVTAVKDKLRKSSPLLEGVKDPFFCMNIKCPLNSYDPNIEPAKDNVLFENPEVVLSAVDQLLKSYYTEAVAEVEDIEPPTSAQQPREFQHEDRPDRSQAAISIYEDADSVGNETPEDDHIQPRWRSSLYGVDEDDLEFLPDNRPPALEEEEGIRAAGVSNPWTIARMNAAVKPKKSITNGQLLSPTKSQSELSVMPSSSVLAHTPQRASPINPLTPQTLSRKGLARSCLGDGQERSMQCLSQPSPRGHTMANGVGDVLMAQGGPLTNMLQSDPGTFPRVGQSSLHSPDHQSSLMSQFDAGRHVIDLSESSAPCRGKRNQKTYANKPFTPPAQKPSDTWFGQPMAGLEPARSPHRQKRSKNQEASLITSNVSSSQQEPLHSKNSPDIRNFFGHNGNSSQSFQNNLVPSSSFTPINASARTRQPRGKQARPESGIGEAFPRIGNLRRLQRASSAGSQTSMLFDVRSSHNEKGMESDLRHANWLSQANAGTFPDVPVPRPASVGCGHSSLPSQSSQYHMSAPRHHDQPLRQAQEMDTYFQAIEELEESSPNQSMSPVRRIEPRIAPPHEQSSKTRRLRRRSTAALERTRSSNLPLEHVPRGYNTQDIVLPLATSISSINQVAQKLNMLSNSLDWSSSSEHAYDAFTGLVSELRIMDWVVKLDEILHERHGRIDGVDTRCELHEGIQRVLDTRKEQEHEKQQKQVIETIEDTVQGGETSRPNAEGGRINDVNPQVVRDQSKSAEDDMSDFDMSQFVHLDDDREQQMVKDADQKTMEQMEDEYEDDVEDEMLMGL